MEKDFMCITKDLQYVKWNILWTFQLFVFKKDIYSRFQEFHTSENFDFWATQTVPYHQIRPIARQPALLKISCMNGLLYKWEIILEKLWIHYQIKGTASLHLPPNLAFNPLALIEEPPDVSEVTTQLVSEDSRIESTPKLQQLVPLRDQIFHCRSELFQCDINDSIELSCIGKVLKKRGF